ncbi:MAG: AI-2E family transporter [Elusimicrobiales bacterium]|nr:AI-2E family transporter [Elusimicrobiales bacterium]
MIKRLSLKEAYLPLIFIFLLGLIFYFARKTFIILVLSISFSYLLNPIIKFFEVRGIKRSYIVSMLYIFSGMIFLILTFLVFYIARFDIDSFFNQWPLYYNKMSMILNSFFSKLSKTFPFISQFNIQDRLLDYLTKVPVYLMSIAPYVMILFIVPFISFFILVKGTKILDIIVDNIPSRYVEIVFHIVSRVDYSLGNYLRGVVTDALVLSLIAFFGLFFMNISYYSVIAILVGISCLVPYVGAFVGAFISCIIAFLQYGTIYSVFKVLLFFIFLRFVDDWFIQPYIIQKSVNLNPAVVVLALMAGGEIAGFWGVVFAVPVVCIIREFLYIVFEIHKTIYYWKPPKPLLRVNIPYT